MVPQLQLQKNSCIQSSQMACGEVIHALVLVPRYFLKKIAVLFVFCGGGNLVFDLQVQAVDK